MNFLAHLYLSGNNPGVIVGNFMGDFVKGGGLENRFQPAIVTGITLHRAIDQYTDTHPVVEQSKERLRPKYRHYAPVIVDMYYDHFLAKNWKTYHPDSLPAFAEAAYNILEAYTMFLPEKAQKMLPYMIRGNWLVNYSLPEGIHRALSGMASRTKFSSRMDEAIEDLEAHYDKFEMEFSRFFPDINNFAKAFLTNNPR